MKKTLLILSSLCLVLVACEQNTRTTETREHRTTRGPADQRGAPANPQQDMRDGRVDTQPGRNVRE